FESPGRDGSGVLDHWMREAYALTDYNYELLLNNSRGNLLRVELQRRALVAGQAVGNPELVVRRLTDNAILRRSTTLITNFNTKTERIVLLWKPYGETTTSLYVSDPVNQNTWPEFQLFVRDQSITSENDMVNFRVKVKNPLSPGLNVGPQITSVWPTCTVCIQSEQEPQVYSVAASDLNDAVLHYRWYVNNLLAADFGPTFTFTPNADDAFLPAATPGLHALRVEVVDGQETVKATYQWSVRVRNTVPIAQRMTYTDSAKTLWHLQQAIQTRFAAITNLTWGPTVGVPTTAGANAFNHLLISGSYTRASQQRNFILRIPFTNSLHNDATPKDAALVSEILPWTVGRTSKQVSYRLSNASTLAEILVTPNDDPSFPFSSLSDGVRLSPNLNSVSSLNPTTNLCNGTCAQSFFRGINSDSPFAPAGSMMSGGGLPTASLDKMGTPYFFYASNEGTSLSWSRALGPSSLFATLSDNDRVADLAVNKVTQRLYATVRDPALQRNFLYVYDLKQLESETVPLITVLTIDDPDHPGLPADHRILDLAVDETNHFVYALLPGTGAVAKLHDPGVGIPNASHLEFVGLGSIGISLSDDPGSGRKLVFNPRTAILMGIIRDSNEVFIIDTSTFVLKKFKTESALDELVVFPNNDLTLGIQKPSPTGTPAEGLIYYIR
ncbi:MAG TPA: hypothetical protein PL182_09545, partial [Pseudobdellovibrionaceae bacterium]|nr:hypothetical protein [Pseudobdellovibrionaceae bacterium]